MRWNSLLLVLVSFSLLALKASPVQSQARVPRLEEASCDYEQYYEQDVRCLRIYVLEDRANPNGTVIDIPVAIFRSFADNPAPDPVVYLEGGPGGDALDNVGAVADLVFAPILETRDVIVFDQRGTGYTRPKRLGCPQYGNILYDTLDENLSADEMNLLVIEALAQCQAQLASRGVNLANYHSAANAADLEDIRVVLGYPQWNLYGISYGTRLALTAMRDYPQGIRSVIIDGVLPPQVSMFNEAPANAEHAFNILFLNCTLSPECNARYPRLGTVFYDLVSQLNAAPGSAIVRHPLTDIEYEVEVDGELLIQFTFSALYSEETIPLLPRIIYDVQAGNYSLLADVLEGILYDQEGMSMGMHYSVQCAEEAPFTTRESVAASAAARPILQSFFDNSPNLGEIVFSVCATWSDVQVNPVENEPVVSSIPTLVLSGEFDPITPARWGRLAAQTLSSSYVYEVRGVGHGASVSADPCPMSIVVSFLNFPQAEPLHDCLATMPKAEFLIVDNAVNLVPFSSDLLNIDAVYPEGWLQLAEAVYARSALEDALLIYDVLPGVNMADVLDSVAQEFNIYITPTALETRTVNGFQWQVYQFREADSFYTVAMSERAVTTYLVILYSERYEHNALYQTILLPALDALRG